MDSLPHRLKTYSNIATELSFLSNQQLSDLLDQAEPFHTGVGGTSVLLRLNRVLSKLAYADEVQGASEHRPQNVYGIPEESSTEATKQFAAEVEFRKNSNETLLFVKRIPLTDLERIPENIMSTANLFDLPLYYQYGIGSKGFSAWRELAAHQMASNWVIAGKCPHFPLLYGWRILPHCKRRSISETLSKEQAKKLEPVFKVAEADEGQGADGAQKLSVQKLLDASSTGATKPFAASVEFEGRFLKSELEYWENHPKVCNRLEAIQNASADLILFLEYIPHNLHQWLGKQLTSKEYELEQSLSMMDENIATITEFMSKQKFIHGDLHFKNILTDGTRLYFTDFGLALSSKFELTAEEIEFFNKHHNYDQANAAIGFLDSTFSNLFGKELWSTSIQEYFSSKKITLAPALESRIKRHTPVALAMDQFYQKLMKESRSTPYPTALLEELIGKR
ncbi:MAG: hypothetical protein A3F67_09945 [Verrucomicrobia bacterium RIFCSPHIGHO2_12_FULL_41_10]|nr:MAG: hypothetical protein A3F67_09945 [Verrucomicrobia bacterium RIFCSPHIGHO2_12_FULL_41_10]HLB32770.1 protein kinase [Chthoniobacterales bacterium]